MMNLAKSYHFFRKHARKTRVFGPKSGQQKLEGFVLLKLEKGTNGKKQIYLQTPQGIELQSQVVIDAFLCQE